MSAYDDYMSIAKGHAQAGNLRGALESLRSAQDIDDNDKVRRRIKKIQEAMEDESENETTDEEREEEDSKEGSRDDSGFQVCIQLLYSLYSIKHSLLSKFLGSPKRPQNRPKSI